MRENYFQTRLIRGRVAPSSPFGLRWDQQPQIFKSYPPFLLRYPFDSLSLSALGVVRCVAQEVDYQGIPYRRLNIPSAGNLHPLELYLQCRNIDGLLDGLYYVSAHESSLILLCDLEAEGVEPLVSLPTRWSGVIALVSCVAFRSFWKYQERACRYIYLDSGYQLGALCDAMKDYDKNPTFLSIQDPHALGRLMGLCEEERLLCAVGFGTTKGRKVTVLNAPIMSVAGTTYFYPTSPLSPIVHFPWLSSSLTGVSLRRRSARHFKAQPLERSLFEAFVALTKSYDENLTIFLIVTRGEEKHGVYHPRDGWIGACEQDQIVKAGYDQPFLKDASLFVVFCGEPSPSTYALAGKIGWHICAIVEEHRWSSSGIGAYYDEEIGDIIQSSLPVLYLIAVGGEV